MQLGFSSTITNTFTGYSHVNTFVDLPLASEHTNEYWIVDTTTGVFLINQKKAGFYKSNGTNWNYIGSSVDMTSLSDGTTSITGSPIKLAGSNGITITSDVPNTSINIVGNNSSVPLISSGSGAPTSTPTKIGDVYIDTTISTHPVFYSAGGNTSSANWVKQNDTYFIQFGVGAHKALNASTTYSFGAIYNVGSLQPSTDYGRIYVPKSGIIKKVNFNSLNSPLASAGASTLYLRVNNATNYLVSGNIDLSSTLFKFDQFDTNIAVTEGQLINLNLVTGAYTTAPGISCNAQLLIET